MNWKEVSNNKIEIIDKKDDCTQIIKTFNTLRKEFFAFNKNRKTQRTKLIKDNLSLLGQKLHYKTYANRLSDHLRQTTGGDFRNKELLWDLHWYTEATNEPYSPIRLPLVMESEWKSTRASDKTKYSGIMYDFQKLIVANAELRLMIFKVNKKELMFIGNYFIRIIERYKHLEKGSKFLFVNFFKDNKTTGFYYLYYKKKTKAT